MAPPNLCTLLIFVSISCWIANTETSLTNSPIELAVRKTAKVQVDLNGQRNDASTRGLLDSLLGLIGYSKPTTPAPQTSGSGGINLNLVPMNCQIKRYTQREYTGNSTGTATVQSPELCVAVCWQFSQQGQKCDTVNYYQSTKKCQLLSGVPVDESNVKTNNDSTCMIPVQCQETSSGSGSSGSGGGSGSGSGSGSVPVPPPFKCGTPSVQPSIDLSPSTRSRTRIVGGSEAAPHSYPWQVSLQQLSSGGYYYHFCGGTLIAPDLIITAAHCLAEKPNGLRVILGAHTIKSGPPAAVNVKKYVVHESYNSKTVTNDIAIIALAQPVTYSSSIMPACLAQSTDVIKAGDRAIVTGWGTLKEGGSTPDPLMQVEVPVAPDANCTKAYGSGYNSKAMLCAGYYQGGKDSCQGDSGGPLIFKSSTTNCYVLRGIVSFGYGCAEKKIPGMYTRVPSYRAWIDNQWKTLSPSTYLQVS